jgi:hypothetical protein
VSGLIMPGRPGSKWLKVTYLKPKAETERGSARGCDFRPGEELLPPRRRLSYTD